MYVVSHHDASRPRLSSTQLDRREDEVRVGAVHRLCSPRLHQSARPVTIGTGLRLSRLFGFPSFACVQARRMWIRPLMKSRSAHRSPSTSEARAPVTATTTTRTRTIGSSIFSSIAENSVGLRSTDSKSDLVGA